MNQLEKLRALREFFAGVPDHKINMDRWSVNFNPDGDNKEYSCMTAGCLAGWAGVYKPFNELGLKIINGQPIYLSGKSAYFSHEAFRRFFEISILETFYLCSPENYITADSDRDQPIPKSKILDRLDSIIRIVEIRTENA